MSIYYICLSMFILIFRSYIKFIYSTHLKICMCLYAFSQVDSGVYCV